MSIIARFLTRMILLRFIVILLGLSAFVLTLEVVGFLTEVLHINSNPLAAVGLYCAARLPGVLNPGSRVYLEAHEPLDAGSGWREFRRSRAGAVSYQLLEQNDDRSRLPGDV